MSDLSGLLSDSHTKPTLRQLFIGMMQVALSSFGGGLSAWSQRIVVEQRQWMTNEAFITGLTVARLFPGPNQVNMAVYIGTAFRGLPGAVAALAGLLLVPFTLLTTVGLLYFQFHTIPAVDRVLAGVVAAAAGMALSMGFKILHEYWRDRMALLLALVTFVALSVFRFHLIPVVLVLGPLAMAWYWPRQQQQGDPAP
ncbi:Chromate transporter [Synechococcus sp. WH 8101]|uniref:chromate transporter n=1 Tax=Synechococcus sp. WH 8101 TaxID=59932 RepID=UPI0010244CB7|nr:chromate transporter [Synechococcus sp. WH 8101]QBE68177.1 Chromate transporter [Synechococcus sp. WH 8101]QNI44386.1 chromate transporter subunit 1 [Synechococcus sp. WH 8101]